MKQHWFELQLIVPGRPVARRVFQADTVEAAVENAQRCFPAAEIVVPEAAAKAVLVRSQNGPNKTRQQIEAILR
jgi:hypothetical protein